LRGHRPRRGRRPRLARASYRSARSSARRRGRARSGRRFPPCRCTTRPRARRSSASPMGSGRSWAPLLPPW